MTHFHSSQHKRLQNRKPMIVLPEAAPDLHTTARTRDPGTKRLAPTSPAPALLEETGLQLGEGESWGR